MNFDNVAVVRYYEGKIELFSLVKFVTEVRLLNKQTRYFMNIFIFIMIGQFEWQPCAIMV